jgi:two-component system sensor histidine kinase BaeS
MRLSIAQKLVAAFVGLTLLVLTATLGLARWSFEQGFLDYVNALEQTRLERVQTDLADEYLSAGHNWGSLSEQRFAALMRRSAPREPFRRPPPRGMPPPHSGSGEIPPPPTRMPGQQRIGAQGSPPTALYDVEGNLVAGASMDMDGALAIRVPIVVEGNTVGELRSEPRRHITSPMETAFSRQQLQTSWVLGISSLILAFCVSLLLARGLLAPVRRMINGVAQLSNGDYSHKMNESRSDELGQLTRDLDRLGSTLEANQSSRRRLLADVSHELRTPLTVLTGEIEALKDGLREFDQTQLDSLDQEVQRLRYLVDDLYELSVSDVGGLRYQFATVDLTDCLQNTINRARERAAALGIDLSLEKPEASADAVGVTISADVQRIEQLLQNLLENSLAYTDALGRVTVTLSQTAATALITIDDTPPGVSESDCAQLFDPLFRQEASRSRRTGGAGLGLAICRNIVTAHGGSISASPSALGGLSVHIEIPLSGESST